MSNKWCVHSFLVDRCTTKVMTLVECQSIHVALMTAGMSGLRAMAHSQINACSCLRCINWTVLLLNDFNYYFWLKRKRTLNLSHITICFAWGICRFAKIIILQCAQSTTIEVVHCDSLVFLAFDIDWDNYNLRFYYATTGRFARLI